MGPRIAAFELKSQPDRLNGTTYPHNRCGFCCMVSIGQALTHHKYLNPPSDGANLVIVMAAAISNSRCPSQWLAFCQADAYSGLTESSMHIRCTICDRTDASESGIACSRQQSSNRLAVNPGTRKSPRSRRVSVGTPMSSHGFVKCFRVNDNNISSG